MPAQAIKIFRFFGILASLFLCRVSLAAEPQVIVTLPEGVLVKVARATRSVDTKVQHQVVGVVTDHKIGFDGLNTDQPYDIDLVLTDGTVLAGAAMRWYTDDDPPKPNAAPMDVDDREAIRALAQDIKDFYNKKDILVLEGNHDHAVALVRLIRDTDFHAAEGDVIWRIELWYFRFHYGGWQKLPQVNRVIRRERFKDAGALEAANKIRWVPALGGIELSRSTPNIKIDLPASALLPIALFATAPSATAPAATAPGVP